MRQKHPLKCPELLKIQEKNDSQTIIKFLPKKMFDQELFFEKVIRWVITTNQPFTAVDHPDFKDMIAYLNPEADTKSSTTLRRRIEDMYQQKK